MSWSEVKHRCPDMVRARLARGLDGLGELLRPVGETGEDGCDGDVRPDAGIDQPAHDLEPLAGWCRSRLRRAPDAVVERRDGNVDGDLRAPSGLLEHVDISPHEGAASDDRGGGAGLRELDDARAGEPVAPFGRLVRIGRGADRHLLTRPRRSGELTAQNLGDVRLDADRAPVAIVGGTVGASFEGTDVTEGAAVHAPGVRVQRPGERHSLDAVECAAARLLAIHHGHGLA